MTEENQVLVQAEAAMKTYRYQEAISLYNQHLDTNPDDLKPLLSLGICHLLNRSEEMFLAIYQKAVALKTAIQHLPDDLLRLFDHYEVLVKRVTAAALVIGTIAGATACSSNHKYSGGVDDAGLTNDTAADSGVALDTDTTLSAHKYSGGVALDTAETE